MLRRLSSFFIIFAFLFYVDQYIKLIFVNGWSQNWDCISLVLAYNHGVAFSMFAFLEENLKYIQIVVLASGLIYLFVKQDIFKRYYLPAALLLAGGFSNIFDRFVHGAVVDYVYWHCWFDFAIFNFADVIIDIAVVWILYLNYYYEKEKKITL